MRLAEQRDLDGCLAIPGTALARAQFTEYTGTETKIGDTVFGPADWTKPVVQVDFESVWEDETTDTRANGITYMSGKVTVRDTATFSEIMRGTSLTVVAGSGYEGTWVGHCALSRERSMVPSLRCSPQ